MWDTIFLCGPNEKIFCVSWIGPWHVNTNTSNLSICGLGVAQNYYLFYQCQADLRLWDSANSPCHWLEFCGILCVNLGVAQFDGMEFVWLITFLFEDSINFVVVIHQWWKTETECGIISNIFIYFVGCS